MYYHLSSISDNTIVNVTQKKKIMINNDKDIRKIMIYIIVVYIIVFIVGIFVGMFIMIKREVILENINIWRTKVVPIML